MPNKRGTGAENPVLQQTIVLLQKAAKKNKAPIWGRVAELLARPTRRRCSVNLERATRLVQNGVGVIPGKLLGEGQARAKSTLAAFAAAKSAKAKAAKGGVTLLTLPQLVEKNPSGKGIQIII